MAYVKIDVPVGKRVKVKTVNNHFDISPRKKTHRKGESGDTNLFS